MSEGHSGLPEQLDMRSTGLVVLESTVMILIDVVALLGNFMVCLAVYRNSRLQTISNMYVVTLAVSDALMAVLAMPFSCVFVITGRWTFGKHVCQFQGLVAFFFAFLSLLTMTATAVNRFLHTVKPTLYRSHVTIKGTFISLAAITFVAAMGAGLSSMAGWAKFLEHHGKVMCFPEFNSNTVEKLYIGFLDIFYILLPMGVIYVCYFRIFRFVRAHKKGTFKSLQGNATSTRNTRFNVEEVKVTKVLFVIVLGFTICWTPIALLDFTDVASSHSWHIPRQIFLLYMYLGYGSSCINPVIYGAMNRAFRVEFLKHVGLYRRNNPITPSNEEIVTLRIKVAEMNKARKPSTSTEGL